MFSGGLGSFSSCPTPISKYSSSAVQVQHNPRHYPTAPLATIDGDISCCSYTQTTTTGNSARHNHKNNNNPSSTCDAANNSISSATNAAALPRPPLEPPAKSQKASTKVSHIRLENSLQRESIVMRFKFLCTVCILT